jgi:hypothetical protein
VQLILQLMHVHWMLVYVTYIAIKQKTGAILVALINAVWSCMELLCLETDR